VRTTGNRTKLQGVTSESLFKDMIAGHARDLANSQTYSLENGLEVRAEKRKTRREERQVVVLPVLAGGAVGGG
jgi:hypothetical protein